MNQDGHRKEILKDRRESQGKWLGYYSATSFFLMFFVTYTHESWIYNNLVDNSSKWNAWKELSNIEVVEERSTWRWYSSGVEIPIHNVKFEKLTVGCQIAWGVLLFGVACLIGFIVYKYWSGKSRLFWLSFLLYVIVPFAIVWFQLYPDMFLIQIKICVSLYIGLIYLMRGSMSFNPHRDIKTSNQAMKKVILSGIVSLYQRYAIILITAIGLISTTFLFALQTSFRSLYRDLTPIFPLIELPTISAQIWLTIIACAGLLIVTREFNIKQRELFEMEFETAPPNPDDTTSILPNPASHKAQTSDKLPYRAPRFGISHVISFIAGWALRGRRR